MFSFYSQQGSEKAKGALCHSDRPKVIEQHKTATVFGNQLQPSQGPTGVC